MIVTTANPNIEKVYKKILLAKHRLKKTIHCYLFVAAFFIFASYFAVVFMFGVNMPLLDDYNFLYDILRIEDHASWHRKLFSIIAQHNEHRIAFSRLIALVQLHTAGHIDFRWLAFFGNLGLLATALFIAWGGGNRGEKKWYSFLLVAPVIFSAYQGYQMFWAMPSISNYWSVAFSLGSLACLNWEHRYRFAFASALALIGVFTCGQGLVLLPVAFLGLLFFRRWKEAAAWLFLSGFIWFIYFKLHHIKVENPENNDLFKAIGWFLVLVGQAPAEALGLLIPDTFIDTPETLVTLLVICGLLICFFAAFLFVKGPIRSHFFLFSATAYVFCLCAAAAKSRSFLPYSYAMSTQYHNWSLLIIGLLSLGTLALFSTSLYRFQIFAGLFSLFSALNLAFWVSEYPFIKGFEDYRHRSKEAFLNTGALFKSQSANRDFEEILRRLKAENKPANMMEDIFLPEDKRIYKERILWRAYLYEAMPLSEIRFEEGIYFDHGKLQYIIGEIMPSSAISRNDSTPRLSLLEENGRYRLNSLAHSEASRVGAGMIFLRDKSAMKKTGGWQVLKSPDLFLKNQAFSSGARLFAVLPEAPRNE